MSAHESRVIAFVSISSILLACGSSDASSDSASSSSGSSATSASSSASASSGTGGSPAYPAIQPSVPEVLSKGGAVLAHPRIVAVVFDGDPLATELASFVQEMGAGNAYWSATTSQYGVGALVGATTVVVHETPPPSAGTADVAAWLEGNTSGTNPLLGAFDEESLYIVFYPEATNVVLEGTGPQCTAFGGYHLDAARADGKTAFYAVVPRCPSANGLTDLEIATLAASHELVEGVANPHPSQSPAYQTVDDEHAAWAVSFSDYPVAEIGDMCALTSDTAIEPPGFQHLVQRIWSNSEAKAFHDPCVPIHDGAVYFNSAPIMNDSVTIHSGLGPIVTHGVHIPVGTDKTIEVALFSNAPRPPWNVQAVDVRNLLGEPKRLDFSLDRDSGENGEVLHLTIHAMATGPLGGAPFAIYSTSGSEMQVWFGFVAN